MERNPKSRSSAFAQRIKSADSMSSFISVSIILLAFLVALNATRNTQVTKLPTLPAQQLDSVLNKTERPQKEILLRQRITFAAIFQGETASLSSHSHMLAKSLAGLLKSNPVSSILVLNSNETDAIDLSLNRAATLNRLLIDSGVPQELFSIVTKTSTDNTSDYLTILFKEGRFNE